MVEFNDRRDGETKNVGNNELVPGTVRKKTIRGVEHTFTLEPNGTVSVQHTHSPETWIFGGTKDIPDAKGKFNHAFEQADWIHLAPDMSEPTAGPHAHQWELTPPGKDPNVPKEMSKNGKKIVPKPPKPNEMRHGRDAFCTVPGCTNQLRWMSFAATDSWGNKQDALFAFPENKMVLTHEDVDPSYYLNRFKRGMK
jgi:hypothetical protein